MTQIYYFDKVARLALPGDNVAIATRRLDAGTQIISKEMRFILDCTVLEGHRFAVQPINVGEVLLSWELPFGVATEEIKPGTYICNAGMLEALQGRHLEFELPAKPNFVDKIEPYSMDEGGFQPVEQVRCHDHSRKFRGYRRSIARGVGTRNNIVLLSTTSRTASYVRKLEERLRGVADAYNNIDGIVAVAHTEGGTQERPNNSDLLLRTLAGFVVHPNVGAVLVVDHGIEAVTNQMLHQYMMKNDYPLNDVPYHLLTLNSGFQNNLKQGEAIVKGWLETVNQTPRTEESVAHLKIALQCGGSDVFSGISGNPLASWFAREVIRYGGVANLAETDELIGAESHVLQRVKDLDTARKFLSMVERFKERVSWHGSTAEGNVSGGNRFRGIYNIVLKSIGAAMKRHPDVRLDYVIEYGERMLQPGFYFMDSPGNDLESIAGQVAAGANMIFFITGNGSITNFPFVPTIKIVTTSQRYELLSKEMDVNAGAYLDGRPMDELGAQMLDLAVEVASGARSVGEKAGHSQVQIWRNWQQIGPSNLNNLLDSPRPSGKSVPIRIDEAIPGMHFQAVRTRSGHAIDQIGLILPTSLCAGQIARIAAERLNQSRIGYEQGLSRFVSLGHTEGCGVSGGSSQEVYVRTLLGYLTHPLVRHCLLLEHGCEKTHNDYMRSRIVRMGLDPWSFGWASVQLDGGIEKVIQSIEKWFKEKLFTTEARPYETVGLESLRLGVLSSGPIPVAAASSLARLTSTIVGAGGTVVVPENTHLLSEPAYTESTLGRQPVVPSLAYGQRLSNIGFHIMETPTKHWVENLTGLGATGVDILLAYVGEHPVQTHPMIPMLQITADDAMRERYGEDIDLALTGSPAQWTSAVQELLVDVASREYTPKLYKQGYTDFQLTRGSLGISL